MNKQYILAAVLAVAGSCGSTAVAQVSIIQPKKTEFFVPPFVIPKGVRKRPDADFAGHGPKMKLTVFLYIHAKRRNELWAQVHLHAQETKNDWTTASGHKNYLVYRHQFAINKILTPTTETHNYTDKDKKMDIFKNFNKPNPFFRQLRYIGDTKGPEAGTKTGVEIHFSKVKIR